LILLDNCFSFSIKLSKQSLDMLRFQLSLSLSDMDESMNSVHSISAMDISPASSPKITINQMPPNDLLLNAFQQQQELLSNMLFSTSHINKNPISDEYDNNSKSVCLYSTVLTENIPDETNQLRQRIITAEPVESTSTIKQSPSNSSGRSFSKILLLIPIVLLIIYLTTQYFHTSVILPGSSSWQNASEYLTNNLIGQDQGLQEFKEAMEKHKNFSIVLIEVMIEFFRY